MKNNSKNIVFFLQREIIPFDLPVFSHQWSTEFVIPVRVISWFINAFTNGFVQLNPFDFVICLFTGGVSSRVQNTSPKLHAFFRGFGTHKFSPYVFIFSPDDLTGLVGYRLLTFQSLNPSSVCVLAPKFCFNPVTGCVDDVKGLNPWQGQVG